MSPLDESTGSSSHCAKTGLSKSNLVVSVAVWGGFTGKLQVCMDLQQVNATGRPNQTRKGTISMLRPPTGAEIQNSRIPPTDLTQ
eukprot:4656353-Amphidinium_carterae.1